MSEETIGEVTEIPEVPKKSRKTLIAVLLIVIVALASVSVFVWWYTQRASTPMTYKFKIQSTPITGVRFTKNGVTGVTSYFETLEEGLYTIVMPASTIVGADVYNFSQWEDGSTDPTRTIDLNADVTLTVTYILVPPLPQEYNVYSKYGFSIEYPKDMTITEEGVIDATANDNSGMIGGESYGPYKGFAVSWLKSSIPATRGDLEEALENIFTSDPNFEKAGTILETTKSGHEMVYQRYTYTEEWAKTYGIFGALYCNVDENLYVLGYEQTTEQEILQIFERYLDSFVCH